MNNRDLCAPALLYVAFSFTHIIIDTYKRMYNTALVKGLIMIVFTFILNNLCQRGLSVVSWLIVFIPFIMMTVITTIVLILFGLSPSIGKIKDDNRDRHDKRDRHDRHDRDDKDDNRDRRDKRDRHDKRDLE